MEQGRRAEGSRQRGGGGVDLGEEEEDIFRGTTGVADTWGGASAADEDKPSGYDGSPRDKGL